MAAARKGTFNGASVYLSRSLVAPEVYDALHDALRLNGAQVFLHCDPSRNSPNDYHVISSPDHEKFEHLRSMGCNLLGPQCILSCAKEHRILPKQGYMCCLAMDGVKVLASGFEREEKVKIEKQVNAMGGLVQTKASLDVNFVIVKNVLAAKYKWALNVLKKPIVNMSWLHQCWTEHRLVPQEAYRILPFTGLTICITRILTERKELEKLIVQNGGIYSADLTKKCTHLVSDAPVGDKYMVARRWGHINIVTRKWVDQSIARKACLDEGCYPVQGASTSCSGMKNSQKEHHYVDMSNAASQPAQLTPAEELEATSSQNNCSFSDATKINNGGTNAPNIQTKDEENIDCRVAEDSEAEDNDLYLSTCRILLVGFVEKEMCKLVSMIRRGGGSRHMLLSERLTHIIIGSPSEIEKKEVRRLAAWGVINVVRATWLEECDRAKKELSVSPRHVASEILLSKDSINSSVEPSGDACGIKKVKSFNCTPVPTILTSEVNKETKGISKLQSSSSSLYGQNNRLLNTFSGKSFCFSSSFPADRKAEVIEWVKQGGGVMVDDHEKLNAHFIIECHGLLQPHADFSPATIVSTHWIRSCLEDGFMQDIGSHILYSPLRCHIPLRGFEGLCFSVSQYEQKERMLLKNLCFTLGAKFTEKLTKKVTHLLCKFTSGLKYEYACKWGIQSVTADWITECITQDMVAGLDQFRPRPATDQEREAGLCTQSQHPTQAARMISGNAPSQLLTESQGPMGVSTDKFREAVQSSAYGKRSRLPECDTGGDDPKKHIRLKDHMEGSGADTGAVEATGVVEAIDSLIAQSKEIRDMKSPGRSVEQIVFSPDHSILGQSNANSNSTFGISSHWLSRTQKEDNCHTSTDEAGKAVGYDPFSETQTESQVVGYEEDLSGRQKIIDRVRSQSMSSTPFK